MKEEPIFEIRNFSTRAVSLKETEAGQVLQGRGIVFNEWNTPIKFTDWNGRQVTIREKITPGAMDGVDISDVLAYYNHTPPVLGRTAAKTMKLIISDQGADYEINLPDTQHGRDVATLAKRGDISGSSFQFKVAPNGETIEKRETDKTVEIDRIINKFALIKEVGPVDDPSYKATTASLKRSMEEMLKEHAAQMDQETKEKTRAQVEKRRRKLRIIKLSKP